jgi:hypothetical protein
VEQDAREAADAIAKIRQLLAAWLKTSKDSREPVAEILLLLEPLDAFIRRPTESRSDAKSSGVARDASGTSYTIVKKRNEDEILVEQREGSAPFRCPHYVYILVVETLAKADPAFAFEELLGAVQKKLPEVPDWQLRVVLRFLTNQQPPLVVRERTKYRGVRPAKLVSEAAAAWKSLAKASK